MSDPLQKQNHKHRLSAELADLAVLCDGERITLRILTSAMGTRGHALFSLFLTLPFLLPIPVPGLSIFFGLCIAIAGSRMAMLRPPWFPKRWMDKPLPAPFFRKTFQSGHLLMKKLEFWIKPRGKFFHRYDFVKVLNGILIAFCGALLALPLPPGTNFPPALAILFLSIGSLEEDGIFLIFGYIAFCLNVVFFTLLPFIGMQGIQALLS